MENEAAPVIGIGAYQKEQLIREAHEKLKAANRIDERDDLDGASFVEWYDRTIPEVKDIKILAGAMEIEMMRRRGEQVIAEGERRGDHEGNQYESGNVSKSLTFPLPLFERFQRFQDRTVASRQAGSAGICAARSEGWTCAFSTWSGADCEGGAWVRTEAQRAA